MPLPIRPPSEPGGGNPPQRKVEEDSLPTIDDGESLPLIDFGPNDSLEKSASEELPSLEDVALPAFSDELPLPKTEELPPVVETSITEDDFDDLFEDFENEYVATNEPERNTAEPEPLAISKDEDFSDLDFDSLFSEETRENDQQEKIESSVQDDDDWDDYGVTEESIEVPAPELEESNQAEEFLDDEEDWDKFFDEEPSSKSSVEDKLEDEEDSWDKEFEDFVNNVEENSVTQTEDLAAEDEQQQEEEPPEDALKPLKKKGKPKRKGKGKKSSGKSQNPILRNLAAIPILGLIFRPLLKLGSIGVAILGLIPLLAIPLVIFLVALGSVPGGSSVTGPDGGAATIGDFSYENGQASAVITNEGEVIASVTPELTLWSYNPFGGGGIFAFEQVGTCSPEDVSVDIDSNATVTVPCEPPAGGLMTKVSGSISY